MGAEPLHGALRRARSARSRHRDGTDRCACTRFTYRQMLDERRATAVAESLGLQLRELQLCALCLFGVATALRGADERVTRRALRFFAPLLWEEGLADPVRTALRRAVESGVTDAAAAAVDVERYGPACRVVKAVVRRLAAEQLREALLLERLRAPPPPWVAADN